MNDTAQDCRRRLTRDELVATQEKVAKINARAEKKGWTGRLVVEFDEETITEKNDAGLEVTKIRFATEITGTAPKYNGWEFLAVLDWHSADTLITRVSPGVELDGVIDRSALRKGECDHCGLTRDRKDIFLLRGGKSGYELRQVGSTCIKDFLGWDANPVFLSASDRDVEESWGSPGSGWSDFTPLTVLAASWAVIQVTGFRPASFDAPTKGTVSFILEPPSKLTEDARKFIAKIQPLFDKAYAQAKIIQDYILSDEFGGNSEYVVNLKAACGSEFVTSRLFGLVVSAPQSWAKSVERSLVRKQEVKLNEWVGTVKERRVFEIQVKSIRCIEGDYGTSYLYVMVDRAGHTFKWFSSNHALGTETTDEWINLKATVKAHTEYEGSKQTQLTRGQVV
jgi:hypothetical protein